jgi:hypothetical protein
LPLKRLGVKPFVLGCNKSLHAFMTEDGERTRRNWISGMWGKRPLAIFAIFPMIHALPGAKHGN